VKNINVNNKISVYITSLLHLEKTIGLQARTHRAYLLKTNRTIIKSVIKINKDNKTKYSGYIKVLIRSMFFVNTKVIFLVLSTS